MTDTLTILGKVATDPIHSQTTSGIPVTNFRVATTHRRFDQASQTWVDAGTNWYSIAAFRQLGEHAKASLRTGDSVIITGRLKVRNWESNGKHGTSVDIDAEAIGHDLRWGTSAFLSASRAASSDRARTMDEGQSNFGAKPAQTQPRDEAEAEPPMPLDVSWADTVDDPEEQTARETVPF